MKLYLIVFAAVCSLLPIAGYADSGAVTESAPVFNGTEGISIDFIAPEPGTQASRFHGKKVLFIDSYHKGYSWSDTTRQGVYHVLKPAGVRLLDVQMDTKRNGTETFKKQAALKIKAIIEQWQPEVVIASDDNASKYLVAEYYKNASLPFVFCGVNWDASVYGYPFENVTGMEEVALVPQMFKELELYARGNRKGILNGDDLSEHKTVSNFRKKLGIRFDKEVYVRNFAEWKQKYLELQDTVDMMIVGSTASLPDWNDKAAEAFVLENTVIPSGTTEIWLMPQSLVGYIKLGEEQGGYAAQTALKILDGAAAKEIPIVANKRARIMLNFKLSQKLSIMFDTSSLKNAEIFRR